MIDNFIDDILKKEGGFQNSSSDNGNWTGGKTGKGTLVGTNLGITAPTLAKWRGVPASSITEADIKNVTAAEAKDIYEKKYYIDTKINLLPQDIQANVLDMAINAGPSRAIKLLQKSAGVTADGKLGPESLEAAKRIDNNSYVDARNNFYTGLVKQNPEKYSKFEKGWINRSNSFKETAPSDPYQLPSPYERRMEFAQVDPRRVDLASKEPSMFQRAVEGMIPSAQASEADQLRVLMGERAKFAQTDPRRTDLLQQQSRMAQERNFFGGESERNNPNREAIATNLAAQDRQRFAQTDPRRVDLGQPVQRSMAPPAPAPREPRYGGYVTDGSGNVVVDGSGLPVQYGAGPEEYMTMEDLLADRGLMGTRGF